MQVTFKTKSGRLSIVDEAANQKEGFEKVGALQEVFEDEPCGKCGGEDIKFQVRHVQDGKKSFIYYEKICRNLSCRARLSFGSHQEGDTLFPKRFEKDGDKTVVIGKNGWVKYNKETGKDE